MSIDIVIPNQNHGDFVETGHRGELAMQDMIDVANRYKARAEFYKERLILYVKETASKGVLFQDYINAGSGVDTIHPERQAYTISVHLDDYACRYRRPTGRG